MNDNEDRSQTQQTKIEGRGKPCKARPWCWLEKAILRAVRDIFDATRDVTSALAVYLALCEIASDEQSDTFTKSIAEIARRAGVAYKTAAKILARLAALKIIAVQGNIVPGTREHAPSTYTLRNHFLTLGNRRICASLPKGLKNPQNNPKNLHHKPTRASGDKRVESPPLPQTQNNDDGVANDKNEPSVLCVSRDHPSWPKFAAYCQSKGGAPTLKGFDTWLKSHPPEARRASDTDKKRAALAAHKSNYERLLAESQARAEAQPSQPAPPRLLTEEERAAVIRNGFVAMKQAVKVCAN